MLIDGRIGQAGPELLYIGSDGDRLDVLEGNAEILATGGELADGLGVGVPAFAIVSGEELEEGSGGIVAEVGDDGGTIGPRVGCTTSLIAAVRVAFL
jgi:hypothetical protein